jgi:5,10-methylenetetrahydromethanopterin reductase
VKFSLRFNNDLPARDYARLAAAAEAAGFDQFWVSHDLFLRSAPVLLTAAALATTRIEIGTCIVNPYTQNTAEIAMLAATLDEISGGRFNLGLAAGAGEFLKWVGITQEKPLTAVRETVYAINALLNGERAATKGAFLRWTDEAYLRFSPRRRVPIYIGAMSPNMLRAIGDIADGGRSISLSCCRTSARARRRQGAIWRTSTWQRASGVRLATTKPPPNRRCGRRSPIMVMP